MSVKTIIAALASLAVAAPTDLSSRAPCLSSDFSLAMQYNGDFLALEAIDSGKPGTLNVIGQKIDYYQGTPIAQTGKSGNASLAFDIKPKSSCETTQSGQFGFFVPDLGELYGTSDPIMAYQNKFWPHFYVAQGSVNPEMTAASQGWYACNITVQDQQYVGLSWGVYNSNGSAPWGCESTQVVQKFNIPCAA